MVELFFYSLVLLRVLRIPGQKSKFFNTFCLCVARMVTIESQEVKLVKQLWPDFSSTPLAPPGTKVLVLEYLHFSQDYLLHIYKRKIERLWG